MIWIFIIAVIVIGAILQVRYNEKKEKEAGEKNNNTLVSLPNFIPTKKIVGVKNSYVFCVDENNKKIAIIRLSTKVIIPFDQIISVEVNEDNTLLQQKSSLRTLGGAVVGGVVAGGAGAVVGGLSGDTKQNKKVSKVQVKIKVRDINKPSYLINCFDCKTMTTEGNPIKPSSLEGYLYKQGLMDANHIADTISAIIDMTDKEEKGISQTNPQQQKTTGSVADELTKLAELKDKGILTEEEFSEQKKALLGNANSSAISASNLSKDNFIVDDTVSEEVRKAINSGQKLVAVNLYIKQTGCSLSEAIQTIESLS